MAGLLGKRAIEVELVTQKIGHLIDGRMTAINNVNENYNVTRYTGAIFITITIIPLSLYTPK